MEKIAVSNANIKKVVNNAIEELGNNADLNFIDVSEVTDMSGMFENSKFTGDISKWDVSKVDNMDEMFFRSKFNGDISSWDTHNVKYMRGMFCCSSFTGNISDWDVSNVKDMSSMFCHSKFNNDISKWDVSQVADMAYMFYNSKFIGDISKWDVQNVSDMVCMFGYSDFNGSISDWDVSNVLDMSNMFKDSKFTGDLSKWDVSKVSRYSYFGTFENTPNRFKDLEKGKEYIGYKMLRGNKICKLLIPAWVEKHKGSENKCRASEAIVLDIYAIDENGNKISQDDDNMGWQKYLDTPVVSLYDGSFVYVKGNTVKPDSFDDDRWKICSHGIHFFLNKEDAVKY